MAKIAAGITAAGLLLTGYFFEKSQSVPVVTPAQQQHSTQLFIYAVLCAGIGLWALMSLLRDLKTTRRPEAARCQYCTLVAEHDPYCPMGGGVVDRDRREEWYNGFFDAESEMAPQSNDPVYHLGYRQGSFRRLAQGERPAV